MEWSRIALHWQKEHGIPIDRVIGDGPDAYTVPQLWVLFGLQQTRRPVTVADLNRAAKNRKRAKMGLPPLPE